VAERIEKNGDLFVSIHNVALFLIKDTGLLFLSMLKVIISNFAVQHPLNTAPPCSEICPWRILHCNIAFYYAVYIMDLKFLS
jgi:hypothetical protein